MLKSPISFSAITKMELMLQKRWLNLLNQVIISIKSTKDFIFKSEKAESWWGTISTRYNGNYNPSDKFIFQKNLNENTTH